MSAIEIEVVKNQVADSLQEGVIRESISDVASKVVLARKKDNTLRVCIDLRKLNCLVLKDRFPVPIVEDVLVKLQSVQFFTVLDLKNVFLPCAGWGQSKKYTS